jgi:hypothetical protein
MDSEESDGKPEQNVEEGLSGAVELTGVLCCIGQVVYSANSGGVGLEEEKLSFMRVMQELIIPSQVSRHGCAPFACGQQRLPL